MARVSANHAVGIVNFKKLGVGGLREVFVFEVGPCLGFEIVELSVVEWVSMRCEACDADDGGGVVLGES